MKKWFSILPAGALILSLSMLNSCSSNAQDMPTSGPVRPEAVQRSNYPETQLAAPAEVKTTTRASYQDLDAAGFKKIMQENPEAVLLDVRTPRETAMGKIEGAIEIDIANPNFAQEIQRLDKSKTYLVYCRSGRRSVSACKAMEDQGFQSLYNLRGGILAWNAQQ